ncbi:MAG: fatty acid desaturase [Leptospira sp.]|nr:fatty acid desaturase [Leptospira sp.]
MKSIRREDRELRKKYIFLKHQNAIGLSITLLSAGGMIGITIGYLMGYVPAWLAILTNGILASFLHEIEHDTIHNLYFRDSKIMQNFIFWIVWLFRGNTVSPWVRRGLHLNHHKVSGNPDDVEERMIGNGMPMGWKRILTMIDQPMSFLINTKTMQRDAKKIYNPKEMVRGSFPVQFIFQTLWYNFIGLSLLLLISKISLSIGSLEILSSTWNLGFTLPEWMLIVHGYLMPIAVVWLIPNFIRQASLQFISSSMHYYGNVRTVNEQTQVLHPWYLIPFQLFCFNFGSTHGIHHFVVNQPFYLRQMVAPKVHPVMKKYGIPFNDVGSNLRANNYKYS